MAIYVGMSGWTFAGWRKKFYPAGLKQKEELHYAAQQVSSIEINGTFYGLQKSHSFQAWHDAVPDDFVFSVKGGQYITHVRRLKEIDSALNNFFASGVLCLKKKLGPILWQFPPNVVLKDDRFEKFLKKIPRTHEEAAFLAKKHSEKLKGFAHTKSEVELPIRHAFEFRHLSFKNTDFLALLKEQNVAVVFAHSGSKSPYMEDLTADFVYLRLHGQEKKYAKGYGKELNYWKSRLGTWSKGTQPKDAVLTLKQKPVKTKRDVFAYFDNEEKQFAPLDAARLNQLLKLRK